jgi:transcriptional regulator with XRE-family HTH domain
MNNDTIGKRIREVRKEKRLTQAEFGAKIFKDGSTISMLESEKLELSPIISLAIANVFAVRREWLETGKEPKYDDRWTLLVDRAKELGEDIYHRLIIHEKANERLSEVFEKLPKNFEFSRCDKSEVATVLYPASLQPVLEAFIDVMTSDDDDAKGSLTRNVYTFQRTVHNERELSSLRTEVSELRNDMEEIKRRLYKTPETDFKTGPKRARKNNEGGEN